MDNTRMIELLRVAVEHIESFEEDEADNVLKSLGFTEEDLEEIRNNEDSREDFIVDDEMINLWLVRLYQSHGKNSADQLTEEEILDEIEEIDGTISNERLWALAEPIHYENIANLDAYRTRLKELLEEIAQKNVAMFTPEWRIVMVSEGGTKHHFMGGYKSEKEAVAAAASHDWRYIDENRFEWKLEVEEESAFGEEE